MWSLRNIYLYLVCFVTLMMMIFGTVNIIGNITDIMYPTNFSYYSPKVESNTASPTESEKINAENRKRHEENQKIQNKKNLVKSVSFVFIAIPVFVYHWRKIEYEKNANKKNESEPV